jgi:hypothetical protein
LLVTFKRTANKLITQPKNLIEFSECSSERYCRHHKYKKPGM